MIRKTLRQRFKHILLYLLTILSPLPWGGVGGGLSLTCGAAGGGLLLLSSCSESDDEEGEYANWQQRNEQFFNSLADSMKQAPTQWFRYKCYSLCDTIEGKPTDYIYAKVIKSGDATSGSPMATDSVRVSYEGRLIPSASYPKGYIFDGTVYGKYDPSTNYFASMLLSQTVDGYVTALLHMHRGDYWRIYIPSSLGYGSNSQNAIPAHSVLIFDLTLLDFAPVGEALPVWSSRRTAFN